MAEHVRLTCPGCGNQWDVHPRADGSMPVTARCPKIRGGCGKLRKVPRTMAVPAPRAAAAVAWEPSSEPRQPHPVGEPCPHCGAPLLASPRGTVRVCPAACKGKVVPAGVRAPYERGTEVTRAAKSQRERDLEALDLAARKGILLRELRALADDDRLDPASVPKVEWFAEEVKAAASGARLDDLTTLFAEAGIRRRHWWQGQPAALNAGLDDDHQAADDGYAVRGEVVDDQADRPAVVVLATPASIAAQQRRAQPRRMTWAEALAVCGWRIAPAPGTCQIIDEHGQRCQRDTGSPPVADGSGRHGWTCQRHYGMLGTLITETNRLRGVA